MKNFIVMVIAFVVTMIFVRFIFNAVMAADIPLWVKYIILR